MTVFKHERMKNEQVNSIKKSLAIEIPLVGVKPILIIGDMGLDEYFWGDVKRISPEAPVPVIEVQKKEHRIGLAAYVAQNVNSLGGQAILVSVVGRDESAQILKKKLLEADVNTDYLITDLDRPTTCKTRIMCEDHHIVRVDQEKKTYLSEAIQEKLFKNFESQLKLCEIVIIEDYGKGIFSEEFIQRIIKASHKESKMILVDPHPTTPWWFYKGAQILTPNEMEAFELSGLQKNGLERDSLDDVASELFEKWGCESLIVTRGKKGMTFYNSNQVAIDVPTYARQVFDVTGAGDTVIAAMAIGLNGGMSIEKSCVFANFASGVVVGKVGCKPCHSEELRAYIEASDSK